MSTAHGPRPSRRRSLQPDVLVVRRADLRDDGVQAPPLLAVEVLSPSTRLRDTALKREVYAEGGVPSYWLVDPHVPSVTVLGLRDGGYREVARSAGAEPLATTLPYAVTVVPARLVE